MKRHVLLAVVGLSPQVITEALYALWDEGRPVDAVRCITTQTGAAAIYATLLARRNSPLDEFCRQYGIDRAALDFSLDAVEVLYRPTGEPMEDIVTEEDNEILLRACLELAHRLTADPDTAVSFLVAGGRKTMTSCLTLAAQCYGRAWDRIYHVLVSPEFENCRAFWFPPRESVPLQLRNSDGEVFYKETKYAQVTLVPIPFFSVRDLVEPALLDRPREPADLLQALVRNEPPVLEVSPDDGKVRFGRLEADLQPAHMALYTFFARRKLDCDRPACADCTDCWLGAWEIANDHATAIARLYHDLPGSRTFDDRGAGTIACLSKENFRSFRTKTNRRLRGQLGTAAAELVKIASTGTRPDTRYGIPLDKTRIRIVTP